jgi:AcrR family transcriptional regulator
VTKRTLYYHFASKDALVAAMLAQYHELALARIRRWSARLAGDAEAMIEALFRDLASWAARPRWAGAGFTRLVMELADLRAIRPARSRGGTRPRWRIGWRASSPRAA